jgi:hypothetical protein
MGGYNSQPNQQKREIEDSVFLHLVKILRSYNALLTGAFFALGIPKRSTICISYLGGVTPGKYPRNPPLKRFLRTKGKGLELQRVID